MAKSWRFVAFRDKQCSRPTCHRAAQALLGPVASLVARFDGVFGADWPAWAPGAAYACLARVDRRVTGEQVCLRTTRWHAATSEGESRMALAPPKRPSDRIPRGQWPSDLSQAAALASTKLGGCRHCKWQSVRRVGSTRGDLRRNTAAHGHGISLGAFRMALALGVDEAGLVSWRSRARRLGGSAA